MCVFLLSLWNWKTSNEGKDGKVGVGLVILHMPSDNCNNAHVTEIRCLIIGNLDFQIVIKVKNMKWLRLKCRLCVIDS